jgi:hypothetical protein
VPQASPGRDATQWLDRFVHGKRHAIGYLTERLGMVLHGGHHVLLHGLHPLDLVELAPRLLVARVLLDAPAQHKRCAAYMVR